jgi:DNA-binding beta-propeller fold protein YncE
MPIPFVGRAGAALLLAAGVAASSHLSSSLLAHDTGTPAPPAPAIRITPLGTYATGQFDRAAAEISAYDPKTQRLFVVNAQSGQVDVLDIASPSTPARLFTIAVDGVANSVAVRDGLIAVAVEAVPKTNPGHIVFMTTDGAVIATVAVGAQPDMLTFTHDGTRVLVANEGEPSDDYTIDPEGSVSIIDLPRQLSRLGQEHVRTVRFDVNPATLDPRIRIF